LFILYFTGERLLLFKRTRKIPLRICITGTRGKSSIARLIASSLREAGYRVLAKTTGSEPVIILPNGEEQLIKRNSPPSILEQKKLLRLAVRHQAEALVAELMSLQPEYIFAESVQILKPTILVITNVRLDHLSQMGSDLKDIAKSLAVSIPPGCTVFVPEEEFFAIFNEIGKKVNSRLIQVSRDSYRGSIESNKSTFTFEFAENMRLALAVSEFLGIREEQALQGMKKYHPDFGSLKVWQTEIGSPPRFFHLISAFAANDPLSTQKVLSEVEEVISFRDRRIIGILNLRSDRGDRTLQWQRAMDRGDFELFHRLLVAGSHAHALKRRVKSHYASQIAVVKQKSPQYVMNELSSRERGDVVVIGIGNMGGFGKDMVRYWERIGKPYGT